MNNVNLEEKIAEYQGMTHRMTDEDAMKLICVYENLPTKERMLKYGFFMAILKSHFMAGIRGV